MLPRLLGAVVGLVIAGMVTAAQAAPFVQDFSFNVRSISGFGTVSLSPSGVGTHLVDILDLDISGIVWGHPYDFQNFSAALGAEVSDGVLISEWNWSFSGMSTDFGNEVLLTILGEGPNNVWIECFNLVGNCSGLQNASDQTSVTFSPSPAAIPLPAAFPLFATALAGMGLLGWRRKRKASV